MAHAVDHMSGRLVMPLTGRAGTDITPVIAIVAPVAVVPVIMRRRLVPAPVMFVTVAIPAVML
jgi:hypothetical protein